MLKDIEHQNEILNTVHRKVCLQNLIVLNKHSTTASAFTLFNKNFYQTVLIYFKKFTQKICITVMTLKDVERHNEILNIVCVKICLKI